MLAGREPDLNVLHLYICQHLSVAVQRWMNLLLETNHDASLRITRSLKIINNITSNQGSWHVLCLDDHSDR